MIELNQIILGDCMDVMREIPDKYFDCIIADPPYMIGASSTHSEKAKAGNWSDVMNQSYFYAAWISEGKRILKDTGHLFCFGNWRSAPVIMKGFYDAKMRTEDMIIWDKDWIGPSGKSAYRPIYEIIIHGCVSEKAEISDRSRSNIIKYKWR